MWNFIFKHWLDNCNWNLTSVTLAFCKASLKPYWSKIGSGLLHLGVYGLVVQYSPDHVVHHLMQADSLGCKEPGAREALPELPWLTPSARRHRQQHKPLRPTSLSIPCCYQAHWSYSTWNSQMGHASQLCDSRCFVNVDGTPGMCILGWVPTSPSLPIRLSFMQKVVEEIPQHQMPHWNQGTSTS